MVHTSTVPWLPSTPELVQDGRLDNYRGRVAVLVHAGHLLGHLLVSAEYMADQVSGRLWWRRWSEFTEVAVVHLRFTDQARTEVFWLDGLDLQTEMQHWASGVTGLANYPVKLRWLPKDQARLILNEDFQLTLDQHHRIGSTTPPTRGLHQR